MHMDYRSVITRALVVGLVVGAILAVYMVLVVEPVVDQAIELEEQMSTAQDGEPGHSHGEGDARFSRPVQRLGGVLAMVLYSLVIATVFGTVYAAVRHRIPAASEFGRVVRLAGVGFVAVALLPALKYPAAPPAVGDVDTVGQRTAQYLGLIAVALVLAWIMARISDRLRSRMSDPARITLLTAMSVVAVGLAFLVLPPSPDAIDPAVPAGLVWDFRVRSFGGLALMWAGLGLGLGWMLDRETFASSSGGGITRLTTR